MLNYLDETYWAYSQKLVIHQNVMDSYKITSVIMNERKGLDFFDFASLLKKRVSFFGIFIMGDKMDELEAKLRYVSNEFKRVILRFKRHENRILKA